MSAANPIRSSTKTEEIDSETERIILDRLATVDHEPKSDAREAIEAIRREIRQRRNHPVPH